jgi:hypothetical protein
MTAESLTLLPAPRIPAPEDTRVTLLVPVTPAAMRDDTVAVPRRVAEAALHLLQAMQVLQGPGSSSLLDALSEALDKGPLGAPTGRTAICGSCRVDVGLGLPHAVECPSEEAIRYRSQPVPAVDLSS